MEKPLTGKRILYLLSIALLFFCACTNENTIGNKQTVSPASSAAEIVQDSTHTPGSTVSLYVSTPIPETTAEPIPVPSPTAFIPTAEPEESPSPYVNEKYYAPEGVYTVAWISDTQHYANTFPEIYPTITTFLSEHKNDLNLVYAIHTGDLVHQYASIENWTRAVDAMTILGDIPYGVLAGNHDLAKKKGIYDNYCKYFGEKVFNNKPWYGESFENNRGHYDLITIGGTDYIFVYMSFEPDEKALRFIKDAFDKYPDRVGFLCLHDFIKTDGALSKDGVKIREKILRTCPNCYFVLCGHRYGFYCLEDTFDDNGDGMTDRTVYEIMANYQAVGKEGGSGYFKLMQFNDNTGSIYFMSYSPYLQDYNWLDDPGNREPRYMMDVTSEEFELAMPWRE